MQAKEKTKGIINEFRAFISRGNVLDMAVGVIMATAFGKITTSLVNNIIMPFVGWIFGGTDLTMLNITLRQAVMDGDTVVKEAVVMGIGTFISAIIDFIIIALVVFAIVKTFNKARVLTEFKKKAEEAAKPPAPPEPTNEEKLLMEIRDLLKEKNK